MKRAGNLFKSIFERERLRQAYHRAAKSKRAKAEVRAFAANLDNKLASIARQITTGTFSFGRFHQFTVYDPKKRLITAPCFEERVVHHAAIGVIEPYFEKWLIDDTYACRVGRGRDAAVRRSLAFAARYPYFLKTDIRRYFDSIPHAKLLSLLERRFKDFRLLEFLGKIVASYSVAPGIGLPIGSLTSQHFANFYLGWFDRVVKEEWRIGGYVRYMDDTAFWVSTSAEARELKGRIGEWLGSELDLMMKPEPFINRTIMGMDFLGFRVFPDRVTLNRRSRVRFRRQLNSLDIKVKKGIIEEAEYQQRATALLSFATSVEAKSWQTRHASIQRNWVMVEGFEPSEPRR